MTEQLQLADVGETPVIKEPEPDREAGLTDLQRFALTYTRDAGHDGIHADEVGAAWHAQQGKHGIDTRCEWDGSNGNRVLRALRKRGLVKYRHGTPQKPGHWYALDERGKPIAAPSTIPYGEFPEGY